MGRFLRNIDRYLASLTLCAMIVVVVVQVTLRSVFSVPLMGGIEWAQYLLICTVFLAASYAAREGEHIRMGELQRLLPRGLRTAITLLIYACGAVFFAIGCYSAMFGIVRNFRNITPMGLPVPLFMLPTALGFALLALQYSILFVREITGTAQSKSASM